MMRAMTSVGPAGENGTITLTACVGYSLADCAAAFCARLELASTRAAQKRSRRTVVFMWSLPGFFGDVTTAGPIGQPANERLRREGTADARRRLIDCRAACALPGAGLHYRNRARDVGAISHEHPEIEADGADAIARSVAGRLVRRRARTVGRVGVERARAGAERKP